MRKSLAVVVLGVAVITGIVLNRTVALEAHHSFAAEFDAKRRSR
jgi:hypothetical protein